MKNEYQRSDEVRKLLKPRLSRIKSDPRKLVLSEEAEDIYRTSSLFEGCSLRETNFQGSDLRGCSFRGCDMRQAEMSQTRLEGADLRDSRIEGIRVDPGSLGNVTVDFSQAAYLSTLLGLVVK